MLGGVAAEVGLQLHRAAASPQASLRNADSGTDWILTCGEVAQWLARAKPGERLRYGAGLQLVRGHTASMLHGLAQAGAVWLFQPRATHGFDFIAVKRAPTAKPRTRRPDVKVGDPKMAIIFKRLQRAAKAGERCPSDAQLGALAMLTVPQVKWRMRKLVLAGRIATRVEPTLTDPRWRIVTITASGAETAAPAGMPA